VLNLYFGRIAPFDYEADGDVDVLISVNPSGLRLFRNVAGLFENVNQAVGFVHPLGGGYGLTLGDYDGDLDLDAFITGLGYAVEPQRNALFRQNHDGTFSDVLQESGDLLASGTNGLMWGTEFFDFDNDGDLDLYLLSEGIGEHPVNSLFRNEGDGTFRRVDDLAFPPGVASSSGVAAFLDYDRDGDLDIYAPAGLFGEQARGAFFRNQVGNRKRWLALELESATGDRHAVGTRVLIQADGVTRLREVRSSAVASSPLLVGLGDATKIDWIQIQWPDGTSQLLRGIQLDRYAEVVQGVDPCTGGPDTDGDDIRDACDNCPLAFNPGQALACGEGIPGLSPPALAALAALLTVGALLALRRRPGPRGPRPLRGAH
jgi:hypothetical protein